MDATQQQTIAAPAFETALRAKAKDVIDTMGQLQVEASPITFDVNGIAVELACGENDCRVTIADGTYQLRVPVDWLTSPPT